MELKVALCQTDIVWGDKKANMARAGKFIVYADADLVILPEMFSTGFDVAPGPLSETMNAETVKWLKIMSADSRKAIICSVIISEDGKYYNRLLFVKPDGEILHYDKRHLFSFSGEDRNFSAGKKRLIVEYKGFRIMPLICYDLRFPVWSRGSGEFDLMIYIASWPSSRIKVWDTLLKARAIENQCYVVGVNRVGNDPSSCYDGHSCVINYYGEVMVISDQGKEEVVEVALDTEPLRAFREKFPAWRDSDRFDILL